MPGRATGTLPDHPVGPEAGTDCRRTGARPRPTEDPKQRIVVKSYGGSRLLSAMSSAAIPSCRPMPRCAARAIKQIGRPGPTTTVQSARTCKSVTRWLSRHNSSLRARARAGGAAGARLGTDRAQNYFALIEHRELNDRPIEVVTPDLALLKRHCECSISESFIATANRVLSPQFFCGAPPFWPSWFCFLARRQ
jgi:hypothetical protein